MKRLSTLILACSLLCLTACQTHDAGAPESVSRQESAFTAKVSPSEPQTQKPQDELPPFTAYPGEDDLDQVDQLIITAEFQGAAATASMTARDGATHVGLETADGSFVRTLEDNALTWALQRNARAFEGIDGHFRTEQPGDCLHYQIKLYAGDERIFLLVALLDEDAEYSDEYTYFRPYEQLLFDIYKAYENAEKIERIATGVPVEGGLLKLQYSFGNGGATYIDCCIENEGGIYTFTTDYDSFGEPGEGRLVVLTPQQVDRMYQSLLALPEPREDYPILPLTKHKEENPGDDFSSYRFAFAEGYEPLSIQRLDSLDDLWMELLKESYSQEDLDILSSYIR